MSEESGAIPGTSVGMPGHPWGSHTDGRDLDIAYYQSGSEDNRLRPVCPHVVDGVEAYRCVGTPTTLDPWRTALFIGSLFDAPDLRVVGLDGRIGPLVEAALVKLCADGTVSAHACAAVRLRYTDVEDGSGWFQFHHHHFHVSHRE